MESSKVDKVFFQQNVALMLRILICNRLHKILIFEYFFILFQ